MKTLHFVLIFILYTDSFSIRVPGDAKEKPGADRHDMGYGSY